MEVISRLFVFFAALLMVQATYSSLQAVSKVRKKNDSPFLKQWRIAKKDKEPVYVMWCIFFDENHHGTRRKMLNDAHKNKTDRARGCAESWHPANLEDFGNKRGFLYY